MSAPCPTCGAWPRIVPIYGSFTTQCDCPPAVVRTSNNTGRSGRFQPGEDLSYYLGPDARCATAEQCAELERTFAEAHAARAGGRP